VNKKIYIIIILIISICFSDRISAQRIKAEVDRSRIFIGEQILLKLSIENAKPGLNWFNFPDSINHIEVVKRNKIDTAANTNSISYTQIINLTSFDSGRWQFPGLSVAGLNQITLPITIDVLPVDVSQLKDYHEIKGIEEVQPDTNWLLVGIIALITIVSVAMIYWLWKRKKKAVIAKPTLAGNQTPVEWALSQIEKLPLPQENNQAEAKKYYTELNTISRQFYEMQLQQKALQKTTDEWMLTLQSIEVDGSIKTGFFQFLRMADSVRFAKYNPPFYEVQASKDVVRQMVERVAMLHSQLYAKYQPQ